jgi:molecular chaperone DnaK (HSP70)
MVGDQAYVMIPANASIPALGRQTFTTVDDNQREMRVLVLEGDFTQASRCNLLGHFDLTGLPPGPKGACVALYLGSKRTAGCLACLGVCDLVWD